MYDQATLVRQLRRLVDLQVSEAEEDALIAEITANVSDPAWMDHIYHSSSFERPDGSLDLDADSKHILSHKAIRL